MHDGEDSEFYNAGIFDDICFGMTASQSLFVPGNIVVKSATPAFRRKGTRSEAEAFSRKVSKLDEDLIDPHKTLQLFEEQFQPIRATLNKSNAFRFKGVNDQDDNSEIVELIYNDYPIEITNQSENKDWEFTIYQKELGVGHHAANPWLQELPDAISKIVWDNYITMSPSDCYKLFEIDTSNSKSAWDGIHLGQEEKAFVATVNVNDIDIKLPVYPLPGQTSGTIGIAMGYGRGGNGEDIGKAAFQSDEFGNHLADENGALVPVGANAFKFCSYSWRNDYSDWLKY